MIAAMTLSDLSIDTGGELFGDASFERVCSDTRSVIAGDLFVALQGEHFDGHQFLLQAHNAGAVAAVVSKEMVAAIPQLKVADTRLALGLIARANRRRFDKPVIALTGSAGKTTTKEMIAAILAEAGAVLATQGNLNNEIGVPQSLLRINADHQFAVIEMGASHAGDIAYLGRFAEPDIALVTNAMSAHIEGFGDLETVAKTKGEIFESLAHNVDNKGVAIINQDDQFYLQWYKQAGKAKVYSFSKLNSAADFYASAITVNAQALTRFTLHTPQSAIVVNSALLGEHNVVNAVAAAAAATAAGASIEQIKNGLEKVQPMVGRLNPHVFPALTVIDDSYNASPGAVKAAVDVLASFAGQRCLVLGTMGELGDQALQSHLEVAQYARQQGIEQLLAVGEYAAPMAASFGVGARAYKEQMTLLDEIALDEIKQLCAVDVVLVKGSRSTRMERVVTALLKKNKGKQ